MSYILRLSLLLNFLQRTLQVSTANSPYYTAAVVEYFPVQEIGLSPKDKTLKNVNNYLSLLNEVTEDIDIVVFPEATITTGFQNRNRTILLALATIIPDPSKNIVVCHQTSENYSQYLISLSCGAKNRAVYLVANVIEKRICTGNKCASDNWDFYNSNVIFDRNGTVVGRYRKYNLFGEYTLNKTSKAELSPFTTDFNVTFGQFICFDLLFDTPANALLRNGIRDFVFPTMWFSELPFLTALQAQEQWAYENDVNFLAAGANNPAVGSGGSAIVEGVYMVPGSNY
ncbi:vanin-like protein 2 isoform X2 [Agrilus planipennis]|uniref:Vanin-like protein 2 isoform X2 n=1 Tax=Agrilus planipennis TaxID=224129 RepID=A0A1W4WME6_AGRPL|nr:vanin-like protein 2 isoform X2 [Agrilus planipennis]